MRYKQRFGQKGYGVYIDELTDCCDEYCIIPLDGKNICSNFENAHYDHIHVCAPYVTRASVEEIDGGKGTLGKLYREFAEYLESRFPAH